MAGLRQACARHEVVHVAGTHLLRLAPLKSWMPTFVGMT